MLDVSLAGEQFGLLPGKGIVRHETGDLLIADPHFGKAGHFRRAGIPVPEAATQADLDGLTAMLTAVNARRLIVLGDWFHARPGEDDAAMAAIGAWRRAFAQIEVVVVEGNHDRHAGPPPRAWGMRLEAGGWLDRGVVYRHEPQADPRGYVFAGHIHPAVRIAETPRRAVRLPCFHVGPQVTVAPAFGRFTGMHVVRPGVEDRVFAVTPEAVFEAPAELIAAGVGYEAKTNRSQTRRRPHGAASE